MFPNRHTLDRRLPSRFLNQSSTNGASMRGASDQQQIPAQRSTNTSHARTGTVQRLNRLKPAFASWTVKHAQAALLVLSPQKTASLGTPTFRMQSTDASVTAGDNAHQHCADAARRATLEGGNANTPRPLIHPSSASRACLCMLLRASLHGSDLVLDGVVECPLHARATLQTGWGAPRPGVMMGQSAPSWSVMG